MLAARTGLRFTPVLALAALAGCSSQGLWSVPAEQLTSTTAAIGTSTTGRPTSTGSFTTGSTSGSTSSGTTSGSSGTSSTSGTSGTSGSTGANCPQNGLTPTLSCSRADGSTSWLLVGGEVAVSCALGAGEAPVSWSGSMVPGAFTHVDVRDAPSAIEVGLDSTTLPIGFGDTHVQLTITATFCQSAPTTATIDLPVLGNILLADHDGYVHALNSGGTDLGSFAALAFSTPPSMVSALADGNVLIGGDGAALVEVDRTGALVATFDTSDVNQNPLFPSGSAPWAAAIALDGSIWVTEFAGEDSRGAIYRFSATGQYLSTVAEPPDPSGDIIWNPMGLIQLPNGEMMATLGSQLDPSRVALFSSSSAGQFVVANVPLCVGSVDGGAPHCSTDAISGLSGAAVVGDGGTVLLNQIYDDDDDSSIAAFDVGTFSLRASTLHPATGIDAWYEENLRGVASFGDGALALGWAGCIYNLDPSTLYPLSYPADFGSTTSCFISAGFLDVRGFAHLGAAP